MAVSITDPPPTATNPSKEPDRANSAAAIKLLSVGSTSALLYSVTLIDSRVRDSIDCSTGKSFAILLSVINTTLRQPLLFTSYPSSAVAPSPNLIAEASNEIIVSKSTPDCILIT